MLNYKLIEDPQYFDKSITLRFQRTSDGSYFVGDISNRSKVGKYIECRIYRTDEAGMIILPVVAVIKRKEVDLANLLDGIEEFANGKR